MPVTPSRGRGIDSFGWRLAIAGACLCVLLPACAPHLFSAPTRYAPLESSRPLGAGNSSVQAAGGYHSETFGMDAATFSLRGAHGLAENVDVSLSAGLVHIDASGSADVDPNIYTGRAGVRWAPPALDNYFAVTGGLGGGGSDGGGLVSADGGFNVAWENDILVPFAAFSLWVSQPAGRQPVDLSEPGEAPGTDIQIAETTWGTSTSIGLFVPIYTGGGPRSGLYLAMSVTTLRDSQDGSVLMGVSPGIEVAF